MTQQPQALLITKTFWAMTLQSNKSRQTACQKHADLADSEALTCREAALPAHPSLRQLKLGGENIQEAEPYFVAVEKLPDPRQPCPKYSPPHLSGSPRNRYPYLPVRFLFILQDASPMSPPLWCLGPPLNSTVESRAGFDIVLAKNLHHPSYNLLVHHVFSKRGEHKEKLFGEERTPLHWTPQCRAAWKSRLVW